MITLVLGGTRSGKSAIAERLATSLATGGSVLYVATGSTIGAAGDDDADMAARISAHRARRPAAWTTIEAGAALAGALRAHPDGTALVDALGTWVAAHDDLGVDLDELVAALVARPGDTVVVSDEVGLGVHPSSEVGRRFRDVLGAVNTVVAEVADEVLLVVAGRVLPLDRYPTDPAATDPADRAD
jgi:adenosyl cobinamide kinase/adenosyl cobinamide phosphate guanylyltransferase